MKSHLVRLCNESGTKGCRVCITSPFPRDGSSFEAFENLKIDSCGEVPFPISCRLPKTGSCWGWEFYGSLLFVIVCNKLRVEVPLVDVRGKTTHRWVELTPNLPSPGQIFTSLKPSMIHCYFQWWNTSELTEYETLISFAISNQHLSPCSRRRHKRKGGREEGQKLLLSPPSWAVLSLQLETSVYFLCKSLWHRPSLMHSLAFSIISWEPKLKDKHFWRKQLNKSIACIISNPFRQKMQLTEIILLSRRCWKCHLYWICPCRRDFCFPREESAFSEYLPWPEQSIGILNQRQCLCWRGQWWLPLVKGKQRSISCSNKWQVQLEALGWNDFFSLCCVSQRLCCFCELYFWNHRGMPQNCQEVILPTVLKFPLLVYHSGVGCS